MHNIDLLTRDELTRIADIREPGNVTIYVPTSAELNESDKARIEVKRRLREAVAQLEAASTDAGLVGSITNAVEELLTDSDFWRRQSHSLAIFVNGSTLSTFRVSDTLIGLTDVSDRFLITPLLRAATFSHSVFVLALSQNSVRLMRSPPRCTRARSRCQTFPSISRARWPLTSPTTEARSRTFERQRTPRCGWWSFRKRSTGRYDRCSPNRIGPWCSRRLNRSRAFCVPSLPLLVSWNP